MGRSASAAEQEVGRLSRGALAGSGAFAHLGRAVAFASGSFLGAAGFVAVVRTAVGDAEELEKAHRALAAQIRANGENIGSFSTGIDRANQRMAHFGHTNVETETALARLTRATGDTHKALGLLQLAADLAAAKHISLEQAALLVGKVADGNVSALNRYGVQIAKGTSVTDALRIAQQRLAGQAAAATTPMGRLHASVTNLESSIGEALLPTINNYVGQAAKWLNQSQNQKRVTDDVRGAVHLLSGVVQAIVPFVRAFAGGAKYAAQEVGGWKHLIELLIGLKFALAISGWTSAIKKFAAGEALGAAEAGTGGLLANLRALKLLGPIAITIGIDEVIKHFTGKDPLHDALTTQAVNDAIPKAGSKNPFPQGTSLFDSYQKALAGKASAADIRAIRSAGVTPPASSDPLRGAQQVASSVVATAKNLGVGSGAVYKWGGGHGGTVKPGDALDCSGYVYQVYTQSGFKGFPGTSSLQWQIHSGPNWTSEVISASEAQPGDVVFMVGSDPPSPGHVGIVVSGRGQSAQVMQYYKTGHQADVVPLSLIRDLVGVKRYFIAKKTSAGVTVYSPVSYGGTTKLGDTHTTTAAAAKKGPAQPIIPPALEIRYTKAQVDKNTKGQLDALDAIQGYLVDRIKKERDINKKLGDLKALKTTRDKITSLKAQSSKDELKKYGANIDAFVKSIAKVVQGYTGQVDDATIVDIKDAQGNVVDRQAVYEKFTYDPKSGHYVFVKVKVDLDAMKKERDKMLNVVLPKVRAQVQATKDSIKRLSRHPRRNASLIAQLQAKLKKQLAELADLIGYTKDLETSINELADAIALPSGDGSDNGGGDGSGNLSSGNLADLGSGDSGAGGNVNYGEQERLVQQQITDLANKQTVAYLTGIRDLRAYETNIASNPALNPLLNPTGLLNGSPITVVNYYHQNPPDVHLYSRQLQFELKSLVG